MSIINLDNTVDFTKQTQFFGETLGIQRYDRYRYPAFHELYKSQNGYFWSPNEISLQKDRLDYQNLTDHEKFIYTSNLRYQILLDSIQSRGTALAFLPFVSLPELEKNIFTWSFFETIHSQSYSHIIQNIYDRPEEVFDHILNTPEIVNRSKSVTKYYDEFIELSNSWNTSSLKSMSPDDNYTVGGTLYDLKVALYLAIVNTNVLEGIRFYTSFACSFGFAENAKMIGSGDIISLIARDEACYIPGHECLTTNGWKLIEDVTLDDKVAQYNTENYTIQFVNPTAIIRKQYEGNIHRFMDSAGDYEQIVTDDHRMIWKDPVNGRIKESLSQHTSLFCKSVPVSGLILGGINELSSEEILNIYFYYCGAVKQVLDGKLWVTLTIRGEFNWRVLGRELVNLGIDYDFNIKYKTNVYTVKMVLDETILLKYFEWVDINGKSSRWAQNLIKLCYYLSNDGKVGNSIPVKFRFNIYENRTSKKLQEVFAISNWNVKLGNPVKNNSGCRVIVNSVDGFTTIDSHQQSARQITKYYNGLVHCLSVPSGAFIVRYNDKVSVGGNCHVRITETIIKNWQKGEDKDFLEIISVYEPVVYDMYKKAVAEEIAWSKYLFDGGSILGLNQVLLEQYIKFLANRRLKAIGMKPIFDAPIKNPLPFMDHYLKSGAISAAPQETEIISYIVGGLDRDMSSNQFADFSL